MSNKGKDGEDAAAKFLENNKFLVLNRNYRCPKGEVDIIALDGETLVFVEVKSYRTLGIESLEYAINKKKQRRIIETAKYFLFEHRKYRYMSVRFDVVYIGPEGITHLASAFMECV